MSFERRKNGLNKNTGVTLCYKKYNSQNAMKKFKKNFMTFNISRNYIGFWNHFLINKLVD